jgi:hypothetical protein
MPELVTIPIAIFDIVMDYIAPNMKLGMKRANVVDQLFTLKATGVQDSIEAHDILLRCRSVSNHARCVLADGWSGAF